jgi:hypothetical protein
MFELSARWRCVKIAKDLGGIERTLVFKPLASPMYSCAGLHY